MYTCSNSCLWCICWWNLDFSWERKSLQILYECWRRAYHALLAQLFIVHEIILSTIRTGVFLLQEFLYMNWLSTIRTGVVFISGFLYMSSFHHPNPKVILTRYIAPLMANFDTIGNDSNILYRDDGKFFFHIQ